MSPDKLIPKLPNLKLLQDTERKCKLKQAENYNKRHQASLLPEANMGDKVSKVRISPRTKSKKKCGRNFELSTRRN